MEQLWNYGCKMLLKRDEFNTEFRSYIKQRLEK